jgi:hypothetical protein
MMWSRDVAQGRRGTVALGVNVSADAPPSLRFSRTAALVFGAFLILVETWRRSHQFGEIRMWPSIFDDYLAGAFLIGASRIAARDMSKGRAWLAGAWGAASGMMFGSFFGQLVEHSASDPSGLATSCIVAVKGVMFTTCVAGLVTALRSHSGTPAEPS